MALIRPGAQAMVARMSRIAIVFGLCAAALSSSAWAAPRVGVVVVSHEGLTEAQADEVAYDVAAAVAQRIEGDAIAGGTVRGLLPKDMPEGCHDQPACGRKLGGTIKTDEVLFLII